MKNTLLLREIGIKMKSSHSTVINYAQQLVGI